MDILPTTQGSAASSPGTRPASPNLLLEHALACVDHGWAVFPLVPNTKRPLIEGGFKGASKSPDVVRGWWARHPNANIGIATGEVSGIVVVDVDVKRGAKGRESLASLTDLPPTLTVSTPSGGFHLVYVSPTGGVRCRNKLLPGIDIKADGGYVVAAGSVIDGKTYEYQDPEAHLAALPDHIVSLISRTDSGSRSNGTGDPGDLVLEGARNETLTKIAGSMRRSGIEEEAIRVALEAVNTARCHPPLDSEEVGRIARSIVRYPAGPSTTSSATLISHLSLHSQVGSWPADLPTEALYGLPGAIVKALEPHSEADPAALLGSFLAGFGVAIGNGPYFDVEGDRHGLRLNIAIVGKSSRGRKGTSWGRVKEILAGADPTWAAKGVTHGLSTGEGLIWAVRDAITKLDTDKSGSERLVTVDAGIEDKRLLVVESELARTLKAMRREGNTLSTILRQAWDSGDLRVMVKSNPYMATGAHIGVIGHITFDELVRYLDSTEAASGFGNRFLWIACKRSKLLPHGGSLAESVKLELSREVAAAVAFAKTAGPVMRDHQARVLWEAAYPVLTREYPGIFGALVSRAEAQVSRLSCLYALLDCSATVRAEHLRAALAFWQRAEDSARYIFGQRLGDPVAETILSAIRAQGRLTQTEISGLFGRHEAAHRIAAALGVLERGGWVSRQVAPTGGRPQQIWLLADRTPAKDANEAKEVLSPVPAP